MSTGPAEIDVDYAPAALGASPFHQDVTMTAAGQVVKVIIPSVTVGTTTAAQSADLQTNDTVEDKGIHITSTSGSAEFAVYGFSNGTQTADAFLGLPVEVLDTEYIVASYGATTGTTISGSQFAIVGTEAGTLVTITPTVAIGSRPAGVPYSVTLGAGNTYLGRAAAGTADLTGTIIVADKKIAVFSGNRCGNVPNGVNACDTLLEQLPPTDAWGRQFLSMPFAGRLNGDRFRVMASTNGTNVSINGSPVAVLNRGGFYETVLTAASEITADKPILVTQFEHSRNFDGGSPPSPFNDPSMMILYPYEQYLQDYTISTPTGAGFDHINYVNLIAPDAAVGLVTVDSVPVPAGAWTAIGTSGFKGVQVALSGPGVHTMTGPQPFGVLASGHGTTSAGAGMVTTYAYPGGMAVAPVATVNTITLTLTGDTKYVGEQACVSATALDPASVGVSGVRVDFTTSVTGAVAFQTTDNSGTTQPLFCYTGTNAGTETVTGAVGTVTGSATVTWLPRPVVPQVTAVSRYYDGTASATIDTCKLVEVAPSPWAGDDVPESIADCAVAGPSTFSDKDSANGKTVTATTISITGGTHPGNYVLTTTEATTTADIWPIEVTPFITADHKFYDGNTTAALLTQGVTGVLPAEAANVGLAVTAAVFSDKNVANGKVVTGTGLSLTGSAAGNYLLSSPTATTTANIMPISLFASVTAADKVYDGNTGATISGCALTGLIAPDVVTCSAASGAFSDKNVGNGKTVTLTGFTSGGPDIGNYIPPAAPTATANITPLPLTATVVANNKPYDGTTAATLGACSLTGVIGGDNVTCSVNPTGTFDTKDVGNGKPVTVTGFALAGTDAGNYTVPDAPTAVANITPIPLTVTANNQSKVYGNVFTFAGTEFGATGLVAGDSVAGVTLVSSGAPATATVAGSPYVITPSAATGVGLGNYTINYVNGSMVVTLRPLTITANSSSKVYGTVFTPGGTEFVAAGLVNTDTVTSVSLASGGSPAASPISGSPYSIVPSTASGTGLANYSITFVNGQLTITPKPLTITANNATKQYGDLHAFAGTEFTTDGLLAGDTVTSATLTSDGAPVNAQVSGSPYSILASGASGTGLGNYTIAYNPGVLTVTPRAITITADNKAKVYGSADPAFTFQVTAGTLVPGDTLSGAPTRVPGEMVATSPYAIEQGTVSASNPDNYAITFVPAELAVTPAPLTITAANVSKNYGDEHVFAGTEFTATGLMPGDTIVSTTLTSAGTPAGASIAGSPYAIVPSAAVAGAGTDLGNYTVNYADGSLTIAPRAVTITADAKTKVYGDSDPALTYQITAGSLLSGDAFTGSLARAAGENVAASPYAITQGTVTLGANYSLTYIGANLAITARPVTVTANDASKVYGDTVTFTGTEFTTTAMVGSESIASVSLSSLGAPASAAVSGSPYAIEPSAAVAGAGTSLSNYLLSYVNGELEVSARPITVTADPQTKVYGTTDPALTYSITAGSLVDGDALTGALTRATGENVNGTPYAITQGTLALNSSYAITFVGADFAITPAPLTITAGNATKNYGDEHVFAGTEFTTTGLVSGDTIASATLTSAGTPANAPILGSPYAIAPSAAVPGGATSLSNYSVSYANGQLTIAPRAVTITADAKTKVYGDSDPALTYQITAGSLLSGDAFTGSLARTAGENVASSPYAITQGTVTLGANYSLTYVGANLDITARPVTVTANDASKVYGDTVTFTGSEFTTTAMVGSESIASVSLSSLGAPPTAAVSGSPYAIEPSAAVAGAGTSLSNYLLSYVNGELEVSARPITVTADPQTKVYGTADPGLTYSITAGTLVDGDALTGALTRAAGENVNGTPYAITQGTLALNSSYAITFVGADFAITPAPLTITAGNATKNYGDEHVFAGTEFTTTGLVSGDTIASATLTSAGTPAAASIPGSPYPIVPSAAVPGPSTSLSNYAVSYANGQLTVLPRAVTITADAKTKIYGDSDPALTYQVTAGSLLSGDEFTGSLVRAAGENVASSPYAINQGTVTLGGNYSLTYIGANLAITARPVTVTANDASKVYGDTVTFTGSEFTTTAMVGSESIASVSLSSLGAPASAAVSGSPYAIEPSAAVAGAGTSLDNYLVSYADGELLVSARPITVTADPQTKVYGDTDPGLTYSVTAGSLVPGDTFTGALVRAAGENVNGTPYAITQGTLALNSSYAITFIGADFAITPAPLTITASNDTKNYGDVLTFGGTEFTTSGLKFADTVSSATLTSAGAVFNAPVAGSPYPIVPSAAVGANLANYTISYVNGTLTIIPRPVTIKANPLTKIYGTLDPPLTYAITVGSLIGGDSFSGGLTRAPGQNVGTYAIAQGSVSLGPSYTLTYISDSLTIQPRPVTVTASNTSKVYGDVLSFAGTEISVSPMVGSESIVSATLTSAGAPGSATVDGSPYAIAASAAVAGPATQLSNYDVSYVDGQLTVTPLAITITAAPQTKVYGTSDPSLTFGVTSGTLVNGDTLTGSLVRVVGEQVATSPYAIQQGTASVTNATSYAVTFVGSELAITPAPLTITAGNATKNYGDEHVFAGTEIVATGLLLGDTVTGATLASAGTPAAASIAG
ncbi:MAG: MBG domain-containing protein [Vicinamibacterales bacterium]